MGKKKAKKEELVKGDKLRDLMLLVYLNNKYGKGKNEISAFKEILDYSTGGIYSALDNSGYFRRTADGIQFTEKGVEYLNKKILPQYGILKSIGNAFIVLGAFLTLQWIFWTYSQYVWIIPLYSSIPVLAGGLILRFLGMRLHYWTIKREKKITNI